MMLTMSTKTLNKSQNINKQRITRVFLDLDGVIANFCKGARAAMNDPYPTEPFEIPDNWLDMEGKNLWHFCRGHDFWANLDPFPWYKDIIKIVNSNCADWKFMSKPSCDAGSYSGKFEWLKKHVKGGVNRLWLVNGSKALACTGPHHLLIDDNAKNCNEWKEAGGTVYRWTEISANYPQEEVNKRLDEIRKLFIIE